MTGAFWTESELALLDELARAQATNTQAAEMFPARSAAAVQDKYRRRLNELGISRPRGARGNNLGWRRKGDPRMLPKDAAPLPPTPADEGWEAKAKLGSEMLLEAYHRYFEKHVSSGRYHQDLAA